MVVDQDTRVVVDDDGTNVPAAYRSFLDAFGAMTPDLCTATHIGGGIALAAGHCFVEHEGEPMPPRCNTTSIVWGMRGNRWGSRSSCVEILAGEYTTDRDYAIFRVDAAPAARAEVDLSGRPAEGTEITIFGYPHGLPLRWSGTCTMHERAPSGASEGASIFYHACDTEAGNSGSTVLSTRTGRVVGIHNASWMSERTNLATYLADTPIRDFVAATQADTPPAPPQTSYPVSTPWSATVFPDIRMEGNGPFCHTMAVELDGDAAKVKLDLAGTGLDPRNLQGTLAHAGTKVVAFPLDTLRGQNGAFSLFARPVGGFSGSAKGDWTLCLENFGAPATLTMWAVHD
jgi:V8-like Glu-specific endopeptidase